MGKLPTLTKNYEFQRVYGRGKYASSRVLVVYVLPNRTQTLRLGITASKKVGNAVERNRMRRLIRENLRRVAASLPTGRDIVVVARRADDNPGLEQVGRELRYLLGKLGLLARTSPDVRAAINGRTPPDVLTDPDAPGEQR